jgi:iron complex outermembrane receptor protein
MNRKTLSRGVAIAALVIASAQARAQELLPDIDVGQGNRPAVAPEPALAPTATANPARDGGGDRFTGYNPPVEAVSSKTNIPIMQTPFSIQVVPREVLDDQQITSVQDAILTNVSSISANIGAPYPPSFTVRGFNVGQNVYRDGLRENQDMYLDVANLSAIEVIKGPAAMLYGRIEPGGLVNMVTKKPLDTPYYSVQEQVGSYGFTRTTVDATGPVTTDKSILYRINLEYLSTDSFRNFVHDNNYLISPSVTWRPIEQFRITVDAQFQRFSGTDDEDSFPALGNRPAGVPISNFYGEPAIQNQNPDKELRSRIAYNAVYDFNKDWNLTSRLSYSEAYQNFWGTYGSGINELTGVMPRYLLLEPTHFKTLSTNLDLKGKVETGILKHELLIGMDYYTFRNDQYYDNYGGISTLGPINIWAPAYGPGIIGVPPFTSGGYYARDEWKGVYAQDMISAFQDRAHLLLGGRYDWADYASKSSTGYVAANYGAIIARSEAFSPRVGLLIQPLPWLSLYGSYTKAFGSGNDNGVNASTNQPLPPQTGTQWEAGIKAEFFNKGLTATIAYFDITKTNIKTPDPTNPSNSILIGAARSQGVEFDINGRIDENWSVIANFSHDEARVTQANPVTNPLTEYNPFTGASSEQPVVGNRLASVPENQGNLWLKYAAGGNLKGLTVGGGVQIVGAQQGDNANSFQIPAYALVNGMVSYRFEYQKMHITAQLNVKNLLDTTYYLAASSRYQITPGTPRTIEGSLRFEF